MTPARHWQAHKRNRKNAPIFSVFPSDDVELVNTLEDVRNTNLDLAKPKYFIGTTEFVAQVKQTADKIVNQEDGIKFDRNKRYARGLADRIESPSGTISSASTSQSSISREPKDIDD